MRLHRFVPLFALGVVGLVSAARGEEAGFRPLFNGKDLAGWVSVNGAPSTWFVKDDMIVTTGKPTGYLRTDRQYENFILEFDWMHVPPTPKAVGNSGLFVWADPVPAKGTGYSRGIEVQVLVNYESNWATSDGDIFSIWGASCKPDRPHPTGMERCLPSERRTKGANEWNHYRVEGKDGVIKLAVNGKVVSGVSACNPRKGYLALEAEGSECRFKNLRIKELPSSNPPAAEVANLAVGFHDLFDGLTLAGWKAPDDLKDHWHMRDGFVTYDGGCRADGCNLWTEKSYGDFELQLDWRWKAKPQKVKLPTGEPGASESQPKEVEVLDAGDSGVLLRGSKKAEVDLWCAPAGSGGVASYHNDKTQPAEIRAALTPKLAADEPIGGWNRMRLRMKGDRLTVVLNGKTVVDNARLPDVPAAGPIGLQAQRGPIEFGNVFLRELKEE